MAENAIDNGVDIRVKSTVIDIEKYIGGGDNGTCKESLFQIILSEHYKPVHAKFVINCAGLNAANIAMMVGANNFSIEPRKGEYLVLAKSEAFKAKHVIFQCPTERGKGILVSPTLHGNLRILKIFYLIS